MMFAAERFPAVAVMGFPIEMAFVGSVDQFPEFYFG